MADPVSSTETSASHVPPTETPIQPTETPTQPSLPASFDGQPVMITNHKLTGSNYLSWSRAVEMFIVGRGKDDYLYGEITVPSSTDARFRQWRSENSMIMSWLISSMTPEIGENFMLYTSAAEIWRAAKELYSKRDNVAEIYELETKLNEIRQGDSSVSTYYSQLTKLWQQIDTFDTIPWTTSADEKLFRQFLETKRVFRFLNGLNKDLDSVRSRVLGTKPLPSLNSVFSEIRHEESRLKVMMGSQKGSVLESSALVSSIPHPNGLSQQSGSTGLFTKRSSGGGTGKNRYKPPQTVCKFCSKPGHKVENCFKLQRMTQSQQQNPGARFNSLNKDNLSACSQHGVLNNNPVQIPDLLLTGDHPMEQLPILPTVL